LIRVYLRSSAVPSFIFFGCGSAALGHLRIFAFKQKAAL